MSRRPIREAEIENPSLIYDNLINDYIEGNLDDYTVLYRAVVVAVDYEGGKLHGPNHKTRKALVDNPRGSIKARVITKSLNWMHSDEDLPVFWPLFSHDTMPIKEGEFVYVMFEDPDDLQYGVWFGRMPEPRNVANPNYTPGDQKYKQHGIDETEGGTQQAIQDTDVKVSAPKTSEEFDKEVFKDDNDLLQEKEEHPVKMFRPRVGDRVIEGSNNTLVSLGRDRPSDVESGLKGGAGTIDIVTGRKSQNDMNMAEDKSRVYVSSKTDIDKNFGISDGNLEPAVTSGEVNSVVTESAGEAPSIGLKSDEIRIFARRQTKIVVGGESGSNCTIVIDDAGQITIEAADNANILIGGNTNVHLKGDVARKIDKTLKDTVDGNVKVEFGGEEEKTVSGNSAITREGATELTYGQKLTAATKEVEVTSDSVKVGAGNTTIEAGGSSIALKANKTSLGADTHPIIFGDEFFKELADFIDYIASGKPIGDLGTVPVAPYSTFIQLATLLKVKLKLPAKANTMMTDNHKVGS